MEQSLNKTRERIRLSDPVVEKARAIASTTPPDIPLPDVEAERALALQDQNPSEGVERRARGRHEQAAFRLMQVIRACFDELARVDRQLASEHERRTRLIARGPLDNHENLGREKLFFDQWLKLGLATTALLALGVVSVATTQIMLEDSDLVSSPWQSIAMGTIPFLGALLLAFAVTDSRLVARRDSMRKLVYVSALVLLMLWIPLAAVLFGKQAMSDPTDVIKTGIAAAVGGASSDSSFFGLDFPLLYSIVMLSLDVLAGASFKLCADKVLSETRRVGSSRSGYLDSQTSELQAISAERTDVAEAKAALEGFQGELELGAKVYADAVLAAVFHHKPATPGPAHVAQPIVISPLNNGSTNGRMIHE